MFTDLKGGEANDTVANSRKNPLEAWRRLQKRDDPTTGGGRETFFALSFLEDDVPCGTSRGNNVNRPDDRGNVGLFLELG